MSLSSRPVPWEKPEQDPVYEQLDDVCSWLASFALRDHKRPLRDLSKNLGFHWREFVSFERVAVYERVLFAWVQLVEHGELGDDLWEALYYKALALEVGKSQAGSQSRGNVDLRLAALKAAVRTVAVAFYPHDVASQQSWELSFFANERVTPTKLRRLVDELPHVVDELYEVPAKLAGRRRACEASGLPATLALPTADDLFLHAHDALSSPSSRFARFHSFVHALVVVYRTSANHAHRAHDAYAVAAPEGVLIPLASEQQAHAFVALPLELQVSAVGHVRDLVFDACKRVREDRDLLTSDRMVGLLKAAFLGHQPAAAPPAGFVSTQVNPFADKTYRDEFVGAFAGGEHVLPMRSHAPRSLGRETPSRYFPTARSGSSW